MATTTTRLTLRKPATSDVVNVVTDLNNNYDKIDTEMGFEGRASAPGAPYTGKTYFDSVTGRFYVYNGAQWREFVMVHNIPSPVYASDTVGGTATNKSYGITIVPVNLTFTAPRSGSVYVTVTAALEAATADTCYVSYEVRETNVSGNIVSVVTDDIKAVAQQDGFNHQGSTRSLVTGLTPGATYYARLLSRCVVTSYDVFFSGLLVEPVM